jgi:hypothetical protein
MESADYGQRAMASIEKAERLAASFAPKAKEKAVYEKAMHYTADARYFHGKGDYFSSFGASDYAYGLLEAVLAMRGTGKGKP